MAIVKASEETRELFARAMGETTLEAKWDVVHNPKMKIKNNNIGEVKIAPMVFEDANATRVSVIFVINEDAFDRLDDDAQKMCIDRLIASIAIKEDGSIAKSTPEFCEHSDIVRKYGSIDEPEKGYFKLEALHVAVQNVFQELKEKEEAEKASKKKAK